MKRSSRCSADGTRTVGPLPQPRGGSQRERGEGPQSMWRRRPRREPAAPRRRPGMCFGALGAPRASIPRIDYRPWTRFHRLAGAARRGSGSPAATCGRIEHPSARTVGARHQRCAGAAAETAARRVRGGRGAAGRTRSFPTRPTAV